jgi:hypothetical protein
MQLNCHFCLIHNGARGGWILVEAPCRLIFLYRLGEPNAENKKLADRRSGYWTQFAETVDSNGPGLLQWPACDPNADLMFEIGREVKLAARSSRRPLPGV